VRHFGAALAERGAVARAVPRDSQWRTGPGSQRSETRAGLGSRVRCPGCSRSVRSFSGHSKFEGVEHKHPPRLLCKQSLGQSRNRTPPGVATARADGHFGPRRAPTSRGGPPPPPRPAQLQGVVPVFQAWNRRRRPPTSRLSKQLAGCRVARGGGASKSRVAGPRAESGSRLAAGSRPNSRGGGCDAGRQRRFGPVWQRSVHSPVSSAPRTAAGFLETKAFQPSTSLGHRAVKIGRRREGHASGTDLQHLGKARKISSINGPGFSGGTTGTPVAGLVGRIRPAPTSKGPFSSCLHGRDRTCAAERSEPLAGSSLAQSGARPRTTPAGATR